MIDIDHYLKQGIDINKIIRKFELYNDIELIKKYHDIINFDRFSFYEINKRTIMEFINDLNVYKILNNNLIVDDELIDFFCITRL